MKPRLFFCMIFLCSLLLPAAAVLALQSPTPEASNLFGSIVALSGEVSVNDKPVLLGAEVFQDDKIKTLAGKLEIESQGSRFLIGPFSEITLGPPLAKKDSFIDCIKGTLRSIFHKALGRSFEVRTPTVTAGIRGTDFILHVTPEAGVLFTQQGTVSFSSAGQSVLVSQMQMSQAGLSLTPLKPEAVDVDPQLLAVLNEVEQFCDLKIPPDISGKKELNEIIARWDLNFASYLVDKNEYEKARKLSLLAFFIAAQRPLKAETRLFSGTIALRFLGAAGAALEDFEEILNHYADTPFHEPALYHKGLAYYDLEDFKQTRMTLEQYLQTYPSGKYVENARAILQKIAEK